MVNKTQFYKTKVALAVVLSLGLAACGDSDGDEGSTTTSNSVVEDASGNTLEQAQGTGSVQGTVLDTNALPVMGATVSLAGQTVETDVNGYYHFTDVPVAGVDGSNVGDTALKVYTVTITGPEGYANATVKVTTNNIQIDSGNNGTNANNGQGEASGEQTTWFDGFLAQAETAELPMFSASVTGVLRNCVTGAALPTGVKVALDFTAITGSTTNPGTNQDAFGGVTVGVPTFTTTLGDNGVFTFDNLPTDSDFSLVVEGYSLVTTGSTEATEGALDDTEVSTESEGIVNNLGDMNVCLITSTDDIHPYIAKVDSVIDNNTDDGFKWQVLSQGVDGTQGIVVRFNEALDVNAIDPDAVIVTSQVNFNNAAAGEKVEPVASTVVAADGLSMTITLANALPEMTKFSVWMPRYQYQDTSENRIVTGDASGTEYDASGADDLVPDTAGTSTAAIAASDVFDLNVATSLTATALATGTAGNGLTVDIVDGGVGFVTAVTLDSSGIVVTLDAAAETLDGIAAAIAADTTAASLVDITVSGDGASIVGAATTLTLAGGTAASTEDATGSSEFGVSSDTINDSQFKSEYVRTRLCTYIAPITDPGSIAGEQLVKQVVAADDTIDAVGVFWDNAGSATISNLNGQHDQTQDLLQELWNRKNPTSTQTIIDDTAVITGDLNDAMAIISDTGTATYGAGKWKVVVPGATHGDKVVVTPTAAFNIIGTPITITLEDKVAPTTVIQDSYNYADTFGDDYVNAVAADAGYANGGELSEIGTSGSEGSPILYVTPRLFAKDEAADDDADFNNRADVFRTLAEGNTLNSATTPVPHVTSNRNFVYDVNAIANWAPTSATVGVAFSENVNLVTGEAVEFSVANAAPSTTLSGFVANNGVRNEDYVANDTDQDGYHTYLTHGLIQMTSNDIVGLANLDHNGVLDYTGAVSDTVNGNAALSDALVVIADAIPPLVTRAELDATTFVVTFNEPVVAGTSTIKINNPDSADLSAEYEIALSSATSNADNTVWTWSASSVTLPSRALFSNTTSGLAFSGELDNPNNAAPVAFNGAPELETVSGNFAYAETTGGSVLNHSLLTWANVNDARGNNWAEYRSFYVDVDTDNVIDTQNDGDSSTNDWRLALQDVPVYLATDTIAAFTVQVGLSVTYDNQPSPEIDVDFTATVTSTHPLNLDADQWGGANVAVWDNLAEITANFAVVDVAAGAGAVCGPGTTATDTNGDTVIDALDFCTVDLSAGTATWNADNTVLTLNLTEAVAGTINSDADFEFRKISNNIITDHLAADTVQNGRVVSTIVDSNGDEQSQNVKREF